MRYFIPFLILMLFGCASRKAPKKCGTVAKVVDLKGLDGCGMLFEINQKRLNPIEFKVPKPDLADGTAIGLDYLPLKGVMSTCMAESGSIIVTCITVLKRPCPRFTSVDEILWLADLKQKMRPQKIMYFQNEQDEDLFVLDLGKYKYLYTCQGALDCSLSTEDTKSECYLKFAALKNGATIYSR